VVAGRLWHEDQRLSVESLKARDDPGEVRGAEVEGHEVIFPVQ
jgi:hypothetical protein